MTLPVVRIRGAPREMGRRYGETVAPEISAALSFYEGIAGRSDTDLVAVGRRALGYVDAARETLPFLVDEVEGLAGGAGVPLEAVAALNCLEEVWPAESCTTLVSGRFLLHAEQWYAGHSQIAVIVAHPDDGPSFVSPTCAGFLPAVGMSAAGFAQGIDSLTGLDDRVGIPRVLVSRLALGAASIDDAVAAACIDGRAGGYAHCLAAFDKVVVVETSATTHHELGNQSIHTNHYLAPGAAAIGRRPSAGSLARFARAAQLLGESPPRSLEDCAAILADHHGSPQTICMHEGGPTGDGTVFGMICDLARGVVAVSDGPPCRGRWTEVVVPGFVTPEVSRVG